MVMMSNIICAIILFCGCVSLPTVYTAPISQSFGYLNHVGIDFGVPVGTKIFADISGIVIQEEDNARVYGRYLMIEHMDGYVSLYAHLSEFKVQKGAWVHAGQIIALSGGDPKDNIDGDGWSVGAHLHWEVRPIGHIYNNLYSIDPMKYLISYMMMVGT